MPDPIVVMDNGAVRIIRINRPEKKNALTLAMYVEMTRALREAEASDAIRCVIFAGAPGSFCAGNDIADFLKAADSGFDPRALKFLNALARSQKPLVAAVGGVAIGIGTTMLFHFDHVVAGAGAVFSTPFLKLALIPEAASSLLAPTRMGYARAFSMLVMGRPLSAKVDDVALRAALEIAALPAGVVALARQLICGHLDDVVERINTEAMHFKELLKSDEARAAFEAFLSRRK